MSHIYRHMYIWIYQLGKNKEIKKPVHENKVMHRFLQFLCMTTFLFMLGCQGFPQMMASLENIADDTAIKCEVSKEAVQKDKNIQINVIIKNENDK